MLGSVIVSWFYFNTITTTTIIEEEEKNGNTKRAKKKKSSGFNGCLLFLVAAVSLSSLYAIMSGCLTLFYFLFLLYARLDVALRHILFFIRCSLKQLLCRGNIMCMCMCVCVCVCMLEYM